MNLDVNNVLHQITGKVSQWIDIFIAKMKINNDETT